ncbi:MAG TPA: hypothetical protein VM140_11825 [Burkholderiales bacterium]|nr:hypothetical protein [Burkholderiales bacterium]
MLHLHTATPGSPTIRTELDSFISRVLACSLDIRSLWSIDHSPEEPCLATAPYQLLAFADLATLQALRRATDLHHEELNFLVVIDGDRFESAWGACKVSGSLARWAWRYVSSDEAYYDESRWDARTGHAGSVVRLRRKALLVWKSER